MLLEVLNKKFGLNGTALKWCDYYLRPRGFKVNVNKQYSSPKDITFPVTQGSCLGPVLYSAYAASFQEVVLQNVDIHGFADDHMLKKSFTPNVDEAEVIGLLRQQLSKLNHGWKECA